MLEFLGRVECETIYLVGDIIDVWALRRKWHWPSTHGRVVRRILTLARDGTRVIFIPGNHDEVFRCLSGLSFKGVEIRREHLYRCRDGRRMLICHGDEYDPVQKHTPWLSAWGGVLYCNDGDWVESCTALCETHSGELRLLTSDDWMDEWPGPREFKKAA